MSQKNALANKMDWTGISSDSKKKLDCYRLALGNQAKKATAEFLALCQIIGDAHDLLDGSGCANKFRMWVAIECKMSIRSAYNYLAVHRQFTGICSATVALMEPSALIELANSTVSEEAIQAAIESPKVVTKKDAVAIIKTVKAEARAASDAALIIPMPDAEVAPESEPYQAPKKVTPAAKPAMTTKEQIGFLKSAIKQHNAAMMRMVDELVIVAPDKRTHATVHANFRAIHEALEGWK